ncbi:MAG: hypothetical protein GWO02_18690 [Gammaproteobacteria bacterium]|nr:hypothetical protein [Gammaproteobacteria bacterium]
MTRINALLLLLVLALPTAVGAAEEENVSRANELLFLTDHLANVSQPGTLRYEFHKEAREEKGFTDELDIRVTRINDDGSKHCEVDYFTGERERFFPPIDHATGNPVLLAFLQRDVRDMEQRTGGSWRYFQKRMKIALADAAAVEPVTLSVAGHRVEGTRVRITPFVGGRYRKRFANLADKYYVFTLSEAVPGGIYRLRSVVPADDPSGPPRIEEVLTFEELTHRTARAEAGD